MGDDLDAAPVHLGEQRFAMQIDVVDVGEFDPQSRLLRFGADRVPQQAKLADPATAQAALELEEEFPSSFFGRDP
ncbi:MAG: hypothetical protein ABW298_09285 [Candidatus Binatia bacterium]